MRDKKYSISNYLLSGMMFLQIGMGILWMIRNITVVPSFGDTIEYLEIAETFVMDEYRPVLYPLILRGALEIGEHTGAPYQILLFVLQTVVSWLAILAGLATIMVACRRRNVWSVKNRLKRCFLGVYILTVPMITFMNFSVLTDSLATSMLILFLSGLVLLFVYEEIPWWNYMLLFVSLLIESLLRADRLYSCLVLAVIVAAVRLIRRKTDRKRIAAGSALVMLAVILITSGVNHATQTPGVKGRIKTGFDFILLDRIVWPNMSENYEYFSEEIQSILTPEDAAVFDEHNNNVMYVTAPLVEEAVGAEHANELYREMALTVLKHHPVKLCGQILEDITEMLFTPFSSCLNTMGLCDKNDSWNITCVSTKTGILTRVYNAFYLFGFILLLVWGVLSLFLQADRKEKRRFAGYLKKMLPFFGYGIVITLWFCLGDGAPPNDRYALIIYYNWMLVLLGTFRLLP